MIPKEHLTKEVYQKLKFYGNSDVAIRTIFGLGDSEFRRIKAELGVRYSVRRTTPADVVYFREVYPMMKRHFLTDSQIAVILKMSRNRVEKLKYKHLESSDYIWN